MAGHDELGIECQQAIERADPACAVGLADKRDAAAKQQVAREQQAERGHKHHQVLGRVRRPDRTQ